MERKYHHAGDFIFEEYSYLEKDHTLHMLYRYEYGPQFEEVIQFPQIRKKLTIAEQKALDNAFRLLFLLAGVSYFKAYVPNNLRCNAFEIDAQTAKFIEFVYMEGLGEFAYVNSIDFSKFKGFDKCTGDAPRAQHLNMSTRTCVPVGGGKDSIVTLEALKSQNRDLVLFQLGNAKPITDTIKKSELPGIRVTRSIDQTLFSLNQQGAYNGHVPITAILSSIVVACAILNDFNSIAMSVERSASEATRIYKNKEVNHQFSKSFEFEKIFADYVKKMISPNINYYSLLRPLYEVHIMQKFAQLKDYHAIFLSCNAAFRIKETQRATNWCCDCPKCRFIFLGLAAFMNKDSLIEIFGNNLLAEPSQQQGFDDLCGVGDGKPFECVGETQESAALMVYLSNHKDWENDPVVKSSNSMLNGHDVPLLSEFLKADGEHSIPQNLWTNLSESF